MTAARRASPSAAHSCAQSYGTAAAPQTGRPCTARRAAALAQSLSTDPASTPHAHHGPSASQRLQPHPPDKCFHGQCHDLLLYMAPETVLQHLSACWGQARCSMLRWSNLMEPAVENVSGAGVMVQTLPSLSISSTHRKRQATLMPSSLMMVTNAWRRPVYFERTLAAELLALAAEIGSIWTWKRIFSTSKGFTTRRAIAPATAPAVASRAALLPLSCLTVVAVPTMRVSNALCPDPAFQRQGNALIEPPS